MKMLLLCVKSNTVTIVSQILKKPHDLPKKCHSLEMCYTDWINYDAMKFTFTFVFYTVSVKSSMQVSKTIIDYTKLL